MPETASAVNGAFPIVPYPDPRAAIAGSSARSAPPRLRSTRPSPTSPSSTPRSAIGSGIVMVSDTARRRREPVLASPGPVAVYVVVDDPDALFARAESPPAPRSSRASTDQDYGSREFAARDHPATSGASAPTAPTPAERSPTPPGARRRPHHGPRGVRAARVDPRRTSSSRAPTPRRRSLPTTWSGWRWRPTCSASTTSSSTHSRAPTTPTCATATARARRARRSGSASTCMIRGEPGRATGWHGRARRLLEHETGDCVERGLPRVGGRPAQHGRRRLARDARGGRGRRQPPASASATRTWSRWGSSTSAAR